MINIFSQISYPVFLYCVFVFFIFVSVFSFIVGVSLVVRNATMLRFFDFMNIWVSTRRAIKPLTMPHFVEPLFVKHPRLLGIGIILGAAISIFLLASVDSDAFLPLFLGPFPYLTAKVLASELHRIVLAGRKWHLSGSGIAGAVLSTPVVEHRGVHRQVVHLAQADSPPASNAPWN